MAEQEIYLSMKNHQKEKMARAGPNPGKFLGMIRDQAQPELWDTCCEQEEALNAMARSERAHGTAINESRMMRGHLVRQKLEKSLRWCSDTGCDHTGCGECDPPDAEVEVAASAAVAHGEKSDDDDSDDDFDDDNEILAKMRAQRMGQMRGNAEAASRRESARGSHSRLREEANLAELLADPSDPSPIILHLGLMESDASSEACLWVEAAMSRAEAPVRGPDLALVGTLI